MNLIYSIPNELYYIKNFLDYNNYKKIHNAIFKERKNIKLHSSKGVWDDGLINNIIPPERAIVSKYHPFEILKTLTNHNKFYKLQLKHITTTIHYMKKGSGINWHSDASWNYGATYYINNRWNSQFGGELMFTSKNGHGYIPVVGNSLVLIKSPLEHKVNPVLSQIVPRVSVQMFMK
tara:strand:+ start:1636 stop:2166 length:531 start_codon:yes stop_codon:yes gene_type:complete